MTAKGHRGCDLSGPLRRKMWGREPQSDQGLAGRLRVRALSLCLRSTRRGPVDQGASQRRQTTPEAGAGPSAMRWPTGHTRESEGYGSSCQEAQGQATLPGAGPAPAPHSKAVYTETTECPPAPPVRPFSQELEMTWTTPEKGMSTRIIRLCPAARASTRPLWGHLGRQHPLPEQRFSHFW